MYKVNQIRLRVRTRSGSFHLSHYLKSAVAGYLVSIFTFSLALYTGVSTVAAHLLSAAVGCLLIFCFFQLYRGKSHSQSSPYFTCLAKAFMTFVVSTSIQGAIFQSLQGLPGVNVYAAFSLAAVGGVSIFVMMTALYVFPSHGTLEEEIEAQFVAAILICVTIFIRFVYLGLPELMEQEAYYWNYSQHPALSYLDHPPMVAVLISIGTKLFGISEFGVRIGAFSCWFITAFFSYRLTDKIFGRSAAIGAVMLLATLPLYFGVGFLMTPDAPLHAAWSALIYFLYRVLIEGSSRSWIGVGLSLGLGLLSKYTIVLLGPAILIFLLIDRRARTWFFRPEPYIAVVLAIVLFLPVIIWNFQHDWASFFFQSTKRFSEEIIVSTHLLFGYLAIILTPVGMFAVLMFFVSGNKFFKTISEQKGAVERQRINRTYFLCLLLTLVPFLFFLVRSFTGETKLNWTSPIWLATIPFLGCTVTSVYGRFGSIFIQFFKELWSVLIPVLIVLYAVAFHYVTLGLPGVPQASGPFLIGWDNLAKKIELLVDEAEQNFGNRPIVVGMDHYQITSGLAFYLTKNFLHTNTTNDNDNIDEPVGWHIFGFNSRMYQYWSDTQKLLSKDILAVASKRIRLENNFFTTDLVFKTEIQPIDAIKDNQKVRRFYYRLISQRLAE